MLRGQLRPKLGSEIPVFSALFDNEWLLFELFDSTRARRLHKVSLHPIAVYETVIHPKQRPVFQPPLTRVAPLPPMKY